MRPPRCRPGKGVRSWAQYADRGALPDLVDDHRHVEAEDRRRARRDARAGVVEGDGLDRRFEIDRVLAPIGRLNGRVALPDLSVLGGEELRLAGREVLSERAVGRIPADAVTLPTRSNSTAVADGARTVEIVNATAATTTTAVTPEAAASSRPARPRAGRRSAAMAALSRRRASSTSSGGAGVWTRSSRRSASLKGRSFTGRYFLSHLIARWSPRVPSSARGCGPGASAPCRSGRRATRRSRRS